MHSQKSTADNKKALCHICIQDENAYSTVPFALIKAWSGLMAKPSLINLTF